MSSLVPLFPEKVLPGGVNQELVEMIEAMLDDAKAGRMIAGAFVTVKPDGQCMTAWKGDGSQNALASGILTLLHRYGRGLVG